MSVHGMGKAYKSRLYPAHKQEIFLSQRVA
ncbi:MAG: helix-turn-helix domain-containing protein [Leptospirillum sp.]